MLLDLAQERQRVSTVLQVLSKAVSLNEAGAAEMLAQYQYRSLVLDLAARVEELETKMSEMCSRCPQNILRGVMRQ